MALKDLYKGKKVLITGHTGFKGSWLCKVLLYMGADVHGYSLEAPTRPSLFELLDLSRHMHSHIGDIRDFRELKAVIAEVEPEIVIHLAAQPIVLDSYKDPRYTYETNVMGTVNILEAIRETGGVKSFLNVTTDKVYENNDLKDHPFKEDEKLDGYDPYSNSKSCSELVTHSYKKSFPMGTAISTARAGNVIGGGDFSPHRILSDAMKSVLENKPVEIRNRFSTRPYQFVLEPLFVYLLIAKEQMENPAKQGYYNVGPDKIDAVTTGELMDIFCDIYGEGAGYVDKTNPNAPHEAAYLALDNTLLKKTFGWVPAMHIKQAVSLVVDWIKCYRDKGDLADLMDRQIEEFDRKFLCQGR